MVLRQAELRIGMHLPDPLWGCLIYGRELPPFMCRAYGNVSLEDIHTPLPKELKQKPDRDEVDRCEEERMFERKPTYEEQGTSLTTTIECGVASRMSVACVDVSGPGKSKLEDQVHIDFKSQQDPIGRGPHTL